MRIIVYTDNGPKCNTVIIKILRRYIIVVISKVRFILGKLKYNH